MPTSIDQLRRWLRGGDVEGLPEHPKPKRPPIIEQAHPEVVWKGCPDCGGSGDTGTAICATCDGIGEVPKVPSSFARNMAEKAGGTENRGTRGGKYRINANGTDALLLFGRHRDSKVSDVMETARDYLEWILDQEFPDDLKDIIRYQLGRRGKGKE